MTPAPVLHQVTLTLPAALSDENAADLLSGFEDMALSAALMRENGRHHGAWKLSWIMETMPDFSALSARLAEMVDSLSLPALDIASSNWVAETLPAGRDWLQYAYQSLPPFTAGAFYIYGSHDAGKPVPEARIPLQIDAATAFGSGTHGTTAGCLAAMARIENHMPPGARILDMGTGSGILAIAAWKLWGAPVLAVDIDPEAVRVTEHHAALNQVPLTATGLRARAGDGFNHPDVAASGPYDLIFANILAEPLRFMAPALAAVLKPGGHVILSGMLNDQAADVLEIYKAHGLRPVEELRLDEWSTLLLRA